MAKMTASSNQKDDEVPMQQLLAASTAAVAVQLSDKEVLETSRDQLQVSTKPVSIAGSVSSQSIRLSSVIANVAKSSINAAVPAPSGEQRQSVFSRLGKRVHIDSLRIRDVAGQKQSRNANRIYK
jgi:hypothetical protein